MIRGLHHVGLSVVDLDRSVAFYRELLDTDRVSCGPFSGRQYESIFRLNGAQGRSAMVMGRSMRIELFEFAHPSPEPLDEQRPMWDRGITHFCMSVSDIDAVYAGSRGARGAILWPPVEVEEVGLVTSGRDPDGNRFELLEADASTRSRLAAANSNHVCLSVGNLDRSIEFYRDALGMQVTSEVTEFGGETYDPLLGTSGAAGRGVMLGVENVQIELLEFAAPRPAREAGRPVCNYGITHFCLEVVDIDSGYERLHRRGVTFHCPPIRFFDVAKASYGRDPDGNAFELLEFNETPEES